VQDIIEHARQLGKKIASHPRTVEFLNAARSVAEDSEAQGVLKAYQDQIEKIRGLESSGKAIEPEDKHKLVDSEAKVAGHDKLKLMMKHQADYLEMMNRVNQAMDEAIQENEKK